MNLTSTLSFVRPRWPSAAHEVRPPRTRTHPAAPVDPEPISMGAVVTLVIWLGLLAVGVLGLVLFYARPQPAPSQTADPVHAEMLDVQLSKEVVAPVEPAPIPNTPSEPPPLVQPLSSTPEPPLMTAVAEANAAVEFALPVEGPVRKAAPEQAAYTRRAEQVLSAAPAPSAQRLTFGRGEGKQPAPYYPPRAAREGQEGTVTVRFSVGENGRVLNAEPVSRSPWPLLNESALKTIRERWQFQPGAARLYEVAIRFQLEK